MKRIIMLRHGQSQWNLENRFTGWTDVPLSDLGRQEAANAGAKIKAAGLSPSYFFTSYLRRAIHTLQIAAEKMELDYIPVVKDWHLNERHYGALQGLNKADTAKKYGDEQVHIWRRSYDVRPPQLTTADPRYPGNDPRYAALTTDELPQGESLQDTIARVRPCWEEIIAPTLTQGHDTILVAAHGNSLRALAMMLLHLTPDLVVSLEIPTGSPWLFETDNHLTVLTNHYL